MAETQRRPVPRVDSGELDTALAFLNFNRESVLKKTEGLDDEQVRRVLVITGTNLLGLVQHLAQAERNWFGYHLTGAAHVRGPGEGMRVPRGRSTAKVLDYTSPRSPQVTPRFAPLGTRRLKSPGWSTAST
jgi:hypothetical protein